MSDTEQPQTVGLADVPRITAEHRRCGPKYKGCYAHYPWDHCRADGMVWPCDVEDIRLAIEAQARPAGAPEGLRAALALHYITAIECDHDAKTDTVRCNCSVWTGTPQPSVGAAVQEWIGHVLAALASDTGSVGALDVERLARALDAVEWHKWKSPQIDEQHTHNLARHTAAAYERQGESQ